jgi:hypothetical protein
LTNLFALLLSLSSATVSADPVIRGIVRSGLDGHPVAGVQVEVVDVSLTTRTDSLGTYSFNGLPVGSHALRFSAPKYTTMVAAVLLAEDVFQLDVMLTPAPIELENVKILASTDLVGGTRVLTESGSWTATHDALEKSSLLREPDALRILGATPQVQLAPEAPATVHVRGGSADQNLMLVDGVPVYNAIHSGEVFSAFNPDMIASVRLHGGVPSAKYGGRLSSIVEVETRAPSPVVETRGAFSPTSARVTLDVPLRSPNGGISLGVRHSYSGLFGSRGRSNPPRWADFLGRASLTARGNDLELLLFSSGDRLSFGSAASSGTGTAQPVVPTQFSWSTITSALIWRRGVGTSNAEIRLWNTEARAGFQWPAGTGGARLASNARTSGATTSLSRIDGRGITTASASIEHLPTSYVLSEDVPPAAPPVFPQPLRVSSSPSVASLAIERKQVFGRRWTLSSGMRASATETDHIRWEPRLSLGLAPSEGVALSIGYARSHQYVQSLRNEESLLDAIIGIDLPVATGGTGVPVATGDEVVGIGSFLLGSRTRVTINGYSRWADGLVLVAPVSIRPFATQSFAPGEGRAWGGGLAVEGIAGPLTWSGIYAFSQARRAAFSRSYRPSFAPTHSASLSGSLLVGRSTRLRTSLWAAKGRPTTPVSGGFGWEWQGSISRARKVSGLPLNATDVIASQQLPLYFRVDAGARHEFALQSLGAHFVAFANVDNVLDRRNTIGYTTDAGNSNQKALRMMPLSATFGLEWRF